MKHIVVSSEDRSARILFQFATQSQFMASEAAAEWKILHHCASGIIFSAFAFEAMIDHYGRKRIEHWKDIERSLKRKGRIKTVFNEYGCSSLIGSSNYRKALKCLGLRDSLAHGKTEDEWYSQEISADNIKDEVKEVLAAPGRLERQINLELLNDFLDMLTDIENEIEQVSGAGQFPLTISGTRSWRY